MIEYVCAFAFFETGTFGIDRREEIILIKKNSPVWQKGRYNGIGGKIEPGERPEDAMQREFFEETGVMFPWKYSDLFAIYELEGIYKCYFFTAKDQIFSKCKTMEEEFVFSCPTSDILDTINPLPKVYNLSWLIPLCKSRDTDKGPTQPRLQWPVMFHEDPSRFRS